MNWKRPRVKLKRVKGYVYIIQENSWERVDTASCWQAAAQCHHHYHHHLARVHYQWMGNNWTLKIKGKTGVISWSGNVWGDTKRIKRLTLCIGKLTRAGWGRSGRVGFRLLIFVVRWQHYDRMTAVKRRSVDWSGLCLDIGRGFGWSLEKRMRKKMISWQMWVAMWENSVAKRWSWSWLVGWESPV